jgi:general secretion pathway protein M
MKAWFAGLDPRERKLVIAAAALLLVLLLYVGLWEPLVSNVERLRTSTAQQQAVLSWMQQAAREVKQLRGGGSSVAKPASGRSLLSLVDSSAKTGRLGTALKRVQPDGEKRVRVWLESASFDDLVRWLNTLQQRQGVQVVSSVFEAKENAGRVDARIVFEAGV